MTPRDGQFGSRDRRLLVLFLAVGCVALVGALGVGVSDNPPGLILVYLASASFILVLVHRWQTARRFLILLVASLVGFAVAVVLHNLLYALGEMAKGLPVVSPALEVLHVAFFLVAIFVCPVGALIGGVGSLIAWTRTRRRGTGPRGDGRARHD